MKKVLLISVIPIFMLGCSTLNRELGKMGVPVEVGTATNKMLEKKEPAELSEVALEDAKASEYARNVLNRLEKYVDEHTSLGLTLMRTARVQALSYLIENRIGITRGMLNMVENEAELANLIGHEIGHNVLNHYGQIKKRSHLEKALSYGLDAVMKDKELKYEIEKQQDEINRSGWGKALEAEADRYGAELAAKAGYDPYAFCDLFEKLSGKVKVDALYRLRKIKGTHPALDDRAKILRKYLTSKGYAQNKGIKNPENYQKEMIHLTEIRTGEDPYELMIKKKPDQNKPYELMIKQEMDLNRLDEIAEEIKKLEGMKKSLDTGRFLEIVEEIAQICKKNNIAKEELITFNEQKEDSSRNNENSEDHFLEEEIFQDFPIWEKIMQIRERIKNIFDGITRIGVGSIPVVGDVIDCYEFLTGRDAFTGANLNGFERMMSAFGVFVGSGQAWRQVATRLEAELAQLGTKIVAQNISEGRQILHEAVENFGNGSKWTRIYSKTANAGYENLPYWKGTSVFETTLAKQTEFYRVHGGKNEVGNWLIHFDPRGFTSEQLKDMLALENIPTELSRVTVPSGLRIRVGIAGEIESFGTGGIVQWELMANKGELVDLGVIFENLGDLK